jgi:branched-chain amino acid transport system substrate-binding protein
MKNLKTLYLLSFILLFLSSCTLMGMDGRNSHREEEPRRPVPQAQAQAPAPALPELPAPAQNNANARYKLALLVPLTGKSANIGQSIANAAQMAVLESGSADFQVIPYDTGDTSDTTTQAATQAVADGASIILGPVFSDKVGKVASIARTANLKVISFSNNKAVAGGNVYILGLIPDQQVARILKYASDRGVSGFSGVLPNNVFGNQVAELLDRQVQWFGGAIRKVSLYPAQAPNFQFAAQEIAEAYQAKSIVPNRKGEAVLIPEGGNKAMAIISALRKNDLGNLRLLGTALWDNEATITNRALEGAWFAGTPYEDADSFISRYMTSYGYKPEDIAGLGYDAVTLAMEIAPGNFSDSELRRSQGFKGVKGVYKLNGGNMDVRGYAIYEIHNGAAHVADPAPDHF